MAEPDTGPLLSEHLDELELIVRAAANDGYFDEAKRGRLGIAEAFEGLDYVIDWHDKHDHKLLAAARWALDHGWPGGQSRS
jgi:hypothetical protein